MNFKGFWQWFVIVEFGFVMFFDDNKCVKNSTPKLFDLILISIKFTQWCWKM